MILLEEGGYYIQGSKTYEKKNDFKIWILEKNNICHASSQKTTTLVLRQALRKISAQKGKNCVIFASISPNFYYLLIPQILSELLDRLKKVSKSFDFFSFWSNLESVGNCRDFAHFLLILELSMTLHDNKWWKLTQIIYFRQKEC